MHLLRPTSARPAGVVTAALLVVLTLLAGPRAEAAEPSAEGFTGYAFDARCAPTQEQMDAWLTTSPFWGAGIYIGGSTMSCRPTATDAGQPHLDAAWVATQRANGWRLLPIWVGKQASCHPLYGDRIDPTPTSSYAAADVQGRAEAAAALARARELGIPARSTLWYDLEGGFDVADDDCRRSALRFLSGWTQAVHDGGYRSGVYSSVSAGIHVLDNAANLSPGSYEMPDQVWYAWFNGWADTEVDPRWVRASSWEGERVHQYAAPALATYGGVALTIDRNFLEVDGGSAPPRAANRCHRTRLDFSTYRRLRRGDEGPLVRALQCLLGRRRSALDGVLDRDVVREVRSFQRRHDLRVSGTADAATWTVLLARGSAPLLKVGSTSEAVRRLQRALTAASPRRTPALGVFTDRTAAAVVRYQTRVGLPPTGVVAADTWAALQRGLR